MHEQPFGYGTAISAITNKLVDSLRGLTFGPPVTHVYNTLEYARGGFDQYLFRFGDSSKNIVLLGMNPGPFGMVQTGVPFGDVEMVRDFLGIKAAIGQPAAVHPKRPVTGFACGRGEVSGRRLWGWVRDRYGDPDNFFRQFFVLNYCPLVFMEESGRNRTPDKLCQKEKASLFAVCDQALRESIAVYEPEWVVGIGAFAEQRAKVALKDARPKIGRLTHPSPANPIANRGWAAIVEAELEAMGIG
ncbi:MAG: single-stranded DNA-binding protein [Deltaproteobacteria bacterium]|nr:MAG: single-stranded DNA-binding protein [Deltaproteobacteria bacterium]